MVAVRRRGTASPDAPGALLRTERGLWGGGAGVSDTPPAAPGDHGHPALRLLPALRPVVGELRPGAVVALDGAGPASLAAALVAGATGGGAWCAVAGLPGFGVEAAVGMGADPDRLLLVEDPERRWAETMAALVDGIGLVVTRPPGRVGPTQARQLAARARRGGAVLVVVGNRWEGAWLRLRVTESRWVGLGDGHGHLQGRRAVVAAEGRGAPGGRSARMWLPGADGAVRALEAVPAGRSRPARAVPAGGVGEVA